MSTFLDGTKHLAMSQGFLFWKDTTRHSTHTDRQRPQADSQTDRRAGGQADIQRYRPAIQTYRHADMQTDIHTHTYRHTERHTDADTDTQTHKTYRHTGDIHECICMFALFLDM